MKTDLRPRLEKRPPPRLDLTGPEWKLALTGALGLAWTIAWLALAKPSESVPLPGSPAQPPPSRVDVQAPPRSAAASNPSPRLAAATPAQAPRRAPIRVRTRSS